jgi:hypothetical protein
MYTVWGIMSDKVEKTLTDVSTDYVRSQIHLKQTRQYEGEFCFVSTSSYHDSLVISKNYVKSLIYDE